MRAWASSRSASDQEHILVNAAISAARAYTTHVAACGTCQPLCQQRADLWREYRAALEQFTALAALRDYLRGEAFDEV